MAEAPKAASRKIEDFGEEDEFGAKDFSKDLILKSDCQNRPLWIVSSSNCPFSFQSHRQFKLTLDHF